MVVVGDAADRPAASVKKDDRAARDFLRRVDANRNAADVTILDTDHLRPALWRKLREQRPHRGDPAAQDARTPAPGQRRRDPGPDRHRAVSGKSGSVPVEIGGGRTLTK